MKKNNYEHPFLKVSHTSIGEILCTETIIGTSIGNENSSIIASEGETDEW